MPSAVKYGGSLMALRIYRPYFRYILRLGTVWWHSGHPLHRSGINDLTQACHVIPRQL